MSLNRIFRNLVVVFFAGLLFACNNDVIDDGNDDTETDTTTTSTTDSSQFSSINHWIYNEMATYYLWEDELPNVKSYSKTDPETFFENLLYDDLDKWSFITDDYDALASSLSGTPTTMGYSPAFYLYNNSENVLIVVEYVYPNSPAETAGLKRGDIILTINGVKMDQSNYYDLYSGSSYSVELGTVTAGTLSLSGTSYVLNATEISADPAIFHSVIEQGGKRVGYLVYTEFVEGADNEYLTSLGNIFDEFNSAGITDLVVDLRYNPGGLVDCAGFFASAIAPYSAVANSEILVNMNYNDMLENYFNHYEGSNSENLVYRFSSNSHNMNLSTVYFLTTSGTASACELLISGLRPYMNSIIIGEPTYGKYTGAFVLQNSDDEDNSNWAIIPIVLKYSNADGYTDFVDGLTPDYILEDDLVNAVPFGDTRDPLLAKALEVITGETVTVALKSNKLQTNIKKFKSEKYDVRKNLFVGKSSLPTIIHN
jgi:carboxyl-terminal processing protease